MTPPLYLGIMTGTSLDAIDLAICSFEEWRVQLRDFYSTPWPSAVRELLLELATKEFVRMDDVARANFTLAKEYARAVSEALSHAKLSAHDIRAIGLHGQTVRHLPPTGGRDGATLQLGNGSALATISGIDVVSDFRSADMAVGGQGAPLMPMFDFAFLRSTSADRATLNIGGISNITWLPKNASENEVVAFDCGPGNMLIDLVTQRYYSEPFDRDGAHARAGTVHEQHLRALLAHPYFAQAPPKTTGRELFSEQFIASIIEDVERKILSPDDALATLTELTARSIANSFAFVGAKGAFELIVSGGGAHNAYLLERIAASAKQAAVHTSDEFGISSSAKESIAFAYFALAAIEKNIIHLPKTTGARSRVLLGSVSHRAI